MSSAPPDFKRPQNRGSLRRKLAVAGSVRGDTNTARCRGHPPPDADRREPARRRPPRSRRRHAPRPQALPAHHNATSAVQSRRGFLLDRVRLNSGDRDPAPDLVSDISATTFAPENFLPPARSPSRCNNVSSSNAGRSGSPSGGLACQDRSAPNARQAGHVHRAVNTSLNTSRSDRRGLFRDAERGTVSSASGWRRCAGKAVLEIAFDQRAPLRVQVIGIVVARRQHIADRATAAHFLVKPPRRVCRTCR